MIHVQVMQGDNIVKFAFNKLSDAISFASDCLEVGDPETSIYIATKDDKEEN